NPPANIHEQKFLLVLSGVVIANLEGNSGSQWLHETVSFLPDMAGPQNSGPLHWAIQHWGIPTPPNQNFRIGFSLEEWAPFASLSSIFNQNQSINSGFAVDVWRPNHFGTGTDAFTHAPVGNIFTGVNVDVAVRDTDAWIYRVGYNVTLLGKIAFLKTPKTLFSSNFDPTPDGQPPSAAQAVGTARVEAPAKNVIVIDPPFLHSNKWLQITGLPPTSAAVVSFVGLLTEVDGAGVYNFSALIFMPTGSAVASISFETTSAEEFMHIDFTPDNTVRIDDTVVFGAFARDQVFAIQVTLNIAAAQSTAQVQVEGGGASGSQSYTMPVPFHFLSLQFGAIRLWKGYGDPGSFDATSITVTREP
ncbi:MAG TPA: hypothetical protein VHZ28_06150, partial [Terracidiphilus sp.]|nr:hypothetical protein [Terracidiphilus sp.]